MLVRQPRPTLCLLFSTCVHITDFSPLDKRHRCHSPSRPVFPYRQRTRNSDFHSFLKPFSPVLEFFQNAALAFFRPSTSNSSVDHSSTLQSQPTTFGHDEGRETGKDDSLSEHGLAPTRLANYPLAKIHVWSLIKLDSTRMIRSRW